MLCECVVYITEYHDCKHAMIGSSPSCESSYDVGTAKFQMAYRQFYEGLNDSIVCYQLPVLTCSITHSIDTDHRI